MPYGFGLPCSLPEGAVRQATIDSVTAKGISASRIVAFGTGLNLAGAGVLNTLFGQLRFIGFTLTFIGLVLTPLAFLWLIFTDSRVTGRLKDYVFGFAYLAWILLGWWTTKNTDKADPLTVATAFGPVFVLPAIFRHDLDYLWKGVLTVLIVSFPVVLFPDPFGVIAKLAAGLPLVVDQNVNVLNYSHFFVILSVCAFPNTFGNSNKWGRIGLFLVFVFYLGVVILEGERGPILSVFVTCFITILLQSSKAARIKWLTGLSLLGGGLYLIASQLLPPSTFIRLLEGGANGRDSIYSDSLKDISIFGNGTWTLGTYSHNMVLETLHDYGIVGILLLYLLIPKVWEGLKAIASQEKNSSNSKWLISLMCGVVMMHMFSFSIYFSSLWTAILLPIVFVTAQDQIRQPDLQASS